MGDQVFQSYIHLTLFLSLKCGNARPDPKSLLELKPDDPAAWGNKGSSLANLGRYEEALTAYERALELQSDLPEAWRNLADLLSASGRHVEAEKARLRALQLEREEATC